MRKHNDKKESGRLHLPVRIYFLLISISSLCAACIISFLLVSAGVTLFHEGPITRPFIIGMGLLVCGLCILIGGIMLWFASQHFVKPIEEVSKAVKKVANGDFSVHITQKTRHFGHHEVHDEIDELSENFNTMTSELSGMDYMRKDFMSNVSHEVKTPVAAITGFTDILMENDLSPEEQQEYLLLVNQESVRLSHLCENMLRMSRLDYQKIVRKKDKVRVDEQIRKCIIMLSEKWPDSSGNYELNLESLEIQSDADLLMQVWTNLIDNAIKYSPDGSTITISGRKEGDSLAVTVHNEGEGIREEQRSRIFEKFYQCDASRKKDGSGLGLSIVKRIVDLLGGKIICISEKGKGTTMEVKVPI